jgi:hypothetical protein
LTESGKSFQIDSPRHWKRWGCSEIHLAVSSEYMMVVGKRGGSFSHDVGRGVHHRESPFFFLPSPSPINYGELLLCFLISFRRA